MGSSGTGNLSDYPGGGRGRQGGRSGSDVCNQPITEQLEEVARSAYFQAHNLVPPVGTAVSVIQQTRITVVTTSGEVIGYLPTRYNYLAGCIADGFSYSGPVQASSNRPLPSVLVELSAS